MNKEELEQKAKEYYESEELKLHFTKLTSTGIDDNLENVFLFASNFHQKQLRFKVDEMKASQQENEIILLDRIKELEKGIILSIKKLKHVSCVQRCLSGVIPTNSGPEQCQWCGEIQEIESLLTP